VITRGAGKDEEREPRVANVLNNLAIKSEMPRGEVFQTIEMSERTGRNILKELLDEGLLLSRSEKGAVRPGFPAAAAGYRFPDLYPNEARRQDFEKAVFKKVDVRSLK
jgi:hypothetical protein